MKRLFFLLPDVKSTTSIAAELHQLGVTDKDIHVVGNDHISLEKANIHEANVMQTTDLVPSLERGFAYGGVTGLLAGAVAITFPPADLVLGGGAVLGFGVLGAGFGAWVSSMIGISIPNPTVENFAQAIKQGQLLMLIDIAKEREDEISVIIKEHHPEALIEGIDLPSVQKNAA